MRFRCSFSVQCIAFLVACCVTTACCAGSVGSGFVTSLSSLMLGQSGGTYDAAQVTISVDGGTSDWEGLASATLTHQEINGKCAVNGINVSIRYAWDSDNLYVLVVTSHHASFVFDADISRWRRSSVVRKCDSATNSTLVSLARDELLQRKIR